MQFSLVNKKIIRGKALQFRSKLDSTHKKLNDTKISENLLNLKEYTDAKIIYFYVSKENEIDTLKLIEKALVDGKKVAVPKCINESEMVFYFIESSAQLERGNFGVMEPKDNLPSCNLQEDAFMVVPCLAADIFGYRVGYGKGFYDRYLHKNSIPTAVLCYKKQLCFKLIHDKYDYRCNYVITENKTFKGKGIK